MLYYNEIMTNKDIKNVCAPNITTNSTFSCFSNLEIIEMANAFNNYLKDKDKICNINKRCISTTPIKFKNKSIEQIWNLLYKKLNKLCKNEYCWIELSFLEKIPNTDLKNKIKKYTFKPKMTKTKYAWLSSIDINEVLDQYNLRKNPKKSFKFFGAYSSDFYDYIDFSYTEISKYDSVAFIFNLDRYYQSGSHWVALYIDNNKKTIEYFDSTGMSPNKFISKFIDNIKNILPISYKLLINKNTHQNKNSECGVYSIHYIIQRLNGKNFNTISKTVIDDAKMNKFRNIIFRPVN